MWHFLIILFLFLAGCDTCDNSVNNNNNNFDTELYFTSKPLNSSFLSVFKSDISGNNIQKIIENASIYNPPSKNRFITFVRKDTNLGLNHLYIADLNTKKEELVETENQLFDIVYPKIASDAKNLIFLGGSGKLFLYDISNKIINFVTDKVMINTIATISPDGQKFAYFSNEGNSIVLNVRDINNSENLIFSKKFDSLIAGERWLLTPSWSFSSEKIIFSLFNQENCQIIIANLNGEVQFIESENINFYAPVISHNEKLIAVYSESGNIWIIENNDESLFYKITKNNDIYFNFSPKWSHKDNILSYRAYSINDESLADLYIVKLDNEVNIIEKLIVSNNTFNAFWNNE